MLIIPQMYRNTYYNSVHTKKQSDTWSEMQPVAIMEMIMMMTDTEYCALVYSYLC